ncbi:mandelate racemase [Aureimonas leprariae]|uniref:Mandelate racemase n=1 Tax=Plantimonas leprariae TaxID=2615207 RepID=A0A7V7PMR0_9HYPH|nr:mandelate racemase [Aureimonas leprariae]
MDAAALERHRIAEVGTATIASVYPRTVGRNSFRGSHGNGGRHEVIVLTTDRGHVGWGPPLGPVGDARRFVGRPVAELIDPGLGVAEEALPLDCALHDLAGVILDLPVHRMLGARGSTALPVYSGAIYLDDLDPAEAPAGISAVERNLALDAAAGYRDFKLKLGRGYRWMSRAEGLARDIEVTRLTRERYPDARILVDANDGYSIHDAAEYIAATADVGLYWMEETFAERLEDLLELRRLIDEHSPSTLIADGEYRPNVPVVTKFAAQGLIDVLLMDVLDYGLTAWRRIMPTVIEAGAAISPHAWGWPLKTLYAAQIGAGLGSASIVEGVPGTTTGIDASAYRFEDGILTLPERPGFGLPLTSDAIRR